MSILRLYFSSGLQGVSIEAIPPGAYVWQVHLGGDERTERLFAPTSRQTQGQIPMVKIAK